MKLLRSNFYIIAMLRVRMREINQTRKKKFWRRRSHKWRGIFSLWLHCIAEDHPPFQSEQKFSRRVSLTLPQPWHSNVLRVFCLFILMLVWVRLAQYSRKPCWYDTIDHWYTAKGGRRHLLHLARSTNNFWLKRGNKICHRYQLTSISLLMRKFQLTGCYAYSEFLRDGSFFLSRMLDILQILAAGSFCSDGLKYPA